eukprot:TRINITY_DN2940_c0_g1_i1.p1 TRINITY_DN2940_c0_g1~~TRINITY_DN2940_c0_g1_i1.p1  ORF type:complete len:481 (+),score=112.56 TRINITY_DN2940_c0_g1_i1:14-1456(+)
MLTTILFVFHLLSLSLTEEAPQSIRDGQDFIPLLEWINKSGILMNGGTLFRDPKMGTGIKASSDLPVNHTLLKIPFHLVFSSAGSLNSDIGSYLKEAGIMGRAPLAIHLIYESKNTNSLWKEYLQFLPTYKQIATPMTWSPEEKHELEGSWVLDRTEADIQGIAADYHHTFTTKLFEQFPDKFKASDYSLDDYLWAWAVIWSRVYNLQQKEIHSKVVPNESHFGYENWYSYIPPLADFINHRFDGKVDYEVVQEEEDKYFVVRTTSAIANGEQVFRKYWASPQNNELLRLFGFVDYSQLDENTEGSRVYLNLELNPNDRDLEFKKRWLKEHDIMDLPYPYSDLVVTSQGIPEKVISFLRVYFYQLSEEERRNPQKLPNPNELISKENERLVFLSLDELFDQHLDAYPTTIEEDERELEKLLSGHKKSALLVRMEEKYVLLKAKESTKTKKIVVGEGEVPSIDLKKTDHILKKIKKYHEDL